MKVVIPGGSGHLGTLLARHLHSTGHEVLVLSRHAFVAPWRAVEWDGVTQGAWASEIDGCDAVINLAGRSVDCRYSARNQREIRESRTLSTRAIGEAIAIAKRPPASWVQMSTATIWSHRFDAANDEATGILGGSEPDVPDTWRFSIEVATAWEQELWAARTPRTRKLALRTAMVMSPEGGAFEALLRLVRLGLGGRAGDGRQYVSWIHDEDFVRAMTWLLEHEDVSGLVNVAAPEPLPNDVFMRELRLACGMPFGLPSPRPLLELGAFLIRTETELILKSRRVVPGLLLELGFTFEHSSWAAASRDLVRRRMARGQGTPSK